MAFLHFSFFANFDVFNVSIFDLAAAVTDVNHST